ncbi:hypothetical protein M5K25_007697 [Dendrobium thyrsiflorum]|uniref:Uncharacterized protein n=1 Tax=Dendrobium thyrsiflorum TaxID=117978 RepID=A0ABD0VM71_DENTH
MMVERKSGDGRRPSSCSTTVDRGSLAMVLKLLKPQIYLHSPANGLLHVESVLEELQQVGIRASPGKKMTDRGKEPITDEVRSLDALWANQDNVNRKLDELAADLQRFTVEIRREFNLNRARQPQQQPPPFEQPEVLEELQQYDIPILYAGEVLVPVSTTDSSAYSTVG